jgi:hypothetical protein
MAAFGALQIRAFRTTRRQTTDEKLRPQMSMRPLAILGNEQGSVILWGDAGSIWAAWYRLAEVRRSQALEALDLESAIAEVTHAFGLEGMTSCALRTTARARAA